jgi:hypothetical protein
VMEEARKTSSHNVMIIKVEDDDSKYSKITANVNSVTTKLVEGVI